MHAGRPPRTVAGMIHEPTASGASFTTLAEQARQVRDGELTARELTEQSLERIERLDARINAFRCVLADSARADADAAQARLDRGDRTPLLGVPIAVKDNVDMTGELTTHGTGANDRAATADSEVVKRLRAAGAVIVGKTNLPELAMWGHFTASETHGVTRNPWNAERSTGGSSGGGGGAGGARGGGGARRPGGGGAHPRAA